MDNTVERLTQLQKSVIIGTLLRDGYMRIASGRKDAFLEINHSFKQCEYVDWKYKILQNVCVSGPKTRKGNESRIAYRFYTKQHPEFTELMKMFYVDGKKVIPHTIELNAIILAVWFMDDGSKCSNSDYYLNTQQFNVGDQNKLVKILSDYGLHTRLNKDKKYYRIRFMKSDIPILIEKIKDKIIPSMKYKLS